MISLAEARAHVLGRVAPLDVATVRRDDALGLVTARAVIAEEAVPPFDNSAMDGYAVRAIDVANAPVTLDVVATLAAGADPAGIEVKAGQAVRIMTGAVVPRGADAVVMVERTAREDGERVRIEATARPGENLRAAGDDIQPGDEVLPVGTPITAGHLGVLASIGVADVAVHRRPRVAVLSTGDELVTDGRALQPGQLRDSNRHVLVPMVAETGCEVVDLGVVRDDRDAVAAAVEGAAREYDALLTSGGVSMGDFDEVKAVLSEIANDMRWMQIAIRPAKPFAFGVVERDGRSLPVFGLPGNPVSSVVSFELLARPALRRMLGYSDDALGRPLLRAVAAEPMKRHADGKIHFVRVAISVDPGGDLHASLAGGQGSHQLAGLANANALAVLDDGDGVSEGDDVRVLVFGEVSNRSSS